MAKRVRSPKYPYVDLPKAIERARKFYEHENRNAANVSVARQHWGYTSTSSGGIQTVAALVSFGLMQAAGSKDSRTVKLTNRALRILLDNREGSESREQAIREAAQAPEIHKKILQQYPAGLPSDDNLRHQLLLEWNPAFNEHSVDGFIREMRSTFKYAQLADGGLKPQDDWVDHSQSDVDCPQPSPAASIETGPPVDELIVQEERSGAGNSTQPKIPPALAIGVEGTVGSRRDVFSLPEGEVLVEWPSPLRPDSIQDLLDWLEILKRKIQRSASTERQGSVLPQER